MANIVGENFDGYVNDQINLRQKKLGSFQPDNETLMYLTGKNPWVRLTSGVNVSEDKCKEIGIDTKYQGNELAKKYILFNGVSSLKGSGISLKEGLPTDSSYSGLDSTAAYGFNSSKAYGLVPPPGIESIEVKPKSRGSLRTATINIKCFSKEQFTIIETLFLRLKYTLLLEWGHSMYFDNTGILVKNPINNVYKTFLDLKPPPTPPSLNPADSTSKDPKVVAQYEADLNKVLSSPEVLKELEEGANVSAQTGYMGHTPGENTVVDQNNQIVQNTPPRDVTSTPPNQTLILDTIKSQRLKNSGNYDGFLGWVTNFSWKLVNNVYEISISATTYGDIIESLSAKSPTTTSGEVDSGVIKPSEYSPLGIAIANLKKNLDDDPSAGYIAGDIKYKQLDVGNLDSDMAAVKNIIGAQTISYIPSDLYAFDKATLKFFSPGFLGTGWWNGGTVDTYYIKLGFLFWLIQNFFYKYDSKTNPTNPLPINFFDYKNIPSGTPGNYPSICNITSNLFSVDPNVCLIPTSLDLVDLSHINTACGVGITSNHFLSLANQGKQAGLVMHIHVNMDLILKVLDENVDEEGNVSWLDFIESILSSINQAFVGITNLQLSYDENKNTYFVLDENSPLTPKDFGQSDPDPTEIIVGIVKEGKGSFVLDASIDSQITNKLSSQLAIGAQASGQDIGANTVAISKWNTGLTDRIIPNKVTPYENDSTPEQALNSSFDQEKLIELLGKYSNFSITNEEISELKSLGKTYITSRRDIDTNKGDLISRFFIPISLNLTLDGIAGPKLFQKYTINDIILPKNYQDNIEFIIKGISHKVDKNGWTTELESLSVPKPKGSYKSTPAQSQTTNQTQNSSQPTQQTKGGKIVHDYKGQEAQNVQLILDALNAVGLTDPISQVGVLCTVAKECSLLPVKEGDYAGTANSSIRGLFSTKLGNQSDAFINDLKKDKVRFFSYVYSNIIGNGDAASKDGWIYRGRGFNALTGRGNYKKYGDIVGKNILNNPDLVNKDLNLAAEILVQFLVVQRKKEGSYTQFKTTREAILKFADLNNGNTPNNKQREKALEAERHFKIVG